jgi:acyl-CoA synthetase (AMP-forming)/AMP-acid ligase II
MLDLSKYQSIGGALKDAVEVFANETCLIEADRERENHRLTYREFQDRAMPVAKALQDTGFVAGDRAAIIMTNQSKWLIGAYAIFYSGGMLVPLDYKLTPDEQWQLLKHSGARAYHGISDLAAIGRCEGPRGSHGTSAGHRYGSPD